MKSTLDRHWNRFETVSHEEGLYGDDSYGRISLLEERRVLFEQNPYRSRTCKDFLLTGYQGLTPITDIKTIQKRQGVIRAFAESRNFWNFQKIFDTLHLMQFVTNQREEAISTGELGVLLQRYEKEVDALVKAMNREKGALKQLSGEYQDRFPRKIIRNVVQACQKGCFDYIAVEMDPRDLTKWGGRRKETVAENTIRLHGIMGIPKRNITGRVLLDSNDFGIDTHYLTKIGALKSLSWLDKIYAPLAALLHEAFYLKNEDACLPEINEEGVFEMVDGRPIMPTPKPVGTSLSYDKSSARIILNGIHSGGKSHLLKTIAAYHLIGLSGFPVPAKSAKIPVVRKIWHSFEVEKRREGGSLESEFFERASALRKIGERDLVLIDEFLQHASPDASTDLEPVILDEFYKTGATVIVVTHRGDSLDDKEKWRFYSPGFEEKNGKIVPTYKFQPGKPDQEVLRRHAKQMLEDALNNPQPEKKQEDCSSGGGIILKDSFASESWKESVRERLIGRTSRQEKAKKPEKVIKPLEEEDVIPF